VGDPPRLADFKPTAPAESAAGALVLFAAPLPLPMDVAAGRVGAGGTNLDPTLDRPIEPEFVQVDLEGREDDDDDDDDEEEEEEVDGVGALGVRRPA